LSAPSLDAGIHATISRPPLQPVPQLSIQPRRWSSPRLRELLARREVTLEARPRLASIDALPPAAPNTTPPPSAPRVLSRFEVDLRRMQRSRKNASPVRRILQQRLPAFGLSHEFQHAHLGVVVMHQLALRRQPQQMVVGLSRTPLRGVALSAITIIEGLLIRIIEGRMVA
jgi:hypothetical protein